MNKVMSHLQQYHLLATAAAILAVCFCRLTNQTEDWQVRNISCKSFTTSSVSSQFKNLNNHTLIVFTDCEAGQNLELQSDVFISEVNSLQIKGTQTTTINCTRENTALHFEGVGNLHLENLHILNCGIKNEISPRAGGVNIVNCSNVTVKGVTIERSPNTGLSLVNNRGTVSVENCTFLCNSQKWRTLDQFAPFQPTRSTLSELHARGSGMQVLVGRFQQNSSIKITDCKFLNNSASHGGGLFISVKEEEIGQKFSNSFECYKEGGGLQKGFGLPYSTDIDTHTDTVAVNGTKITIKHCTFSSNQAEYGGGVAVFSWTYPLPFYPDMLKFINSQWTNNLAVHGLAVYVAIPEDTYATYGHLPTPVFTNCNFVENTDKSILHSSYIVTNERSVFYVSGFRIVFQERTVFQGNLGSAIEATSSVLDFQANSEVYFIDNQGIEGGAMNLKASTLYFHDNSSFILKNNRALFSGGAVFAQFADKDSHFTRNCFIQYKGKHDDPRNITFKFINNSAAIFPNRHAPPEGTTNLKHSGDTFWVTTLSPCIEKCIKSLSNESTPIPSVLKCLGDVTIFDRLGTEQREFSTAANHFASTEIDFDQDSMCLVFVNITNNSIRKNPNYNPSKANSIEGTLYVIPGNITTVPFRLIDDLCAEILFHVQVRVFSSEKYMYFHPAHSVITDNHITLYGDENQNGIILLTTVGTRTISAKLNVFMDECPPGFIHNRTENACVCSANKENTEYVGIVSCRGSSASVQHGYWVGYLDELSNELRENTLATTLCPKGFCTNNTESKRSYQLPLNNSEDIGIYICNANRTGLVCGKCKDSVSTYYRSTIFSCKSNDLCHLGWLFYILSELIPVTLFFLVVIALNISFTSGPLNGVIFFMQVVGTLKIKAENFIWFKGPAQTITHVYRVLYQMFSLDFFSLESLSFCLWTGATTLDILAFKYVTIIYSLLLITGTVALLKVCNFKFCNRYAINLKRSIIHGLSAFLVVSYSECTRVSLMILTRGTLRIGPNNHLDVRSFAFYNGEVSYMGPEHLKYALPAIFFIVTLVSIPPLLLISYPLCYKLFALLGLEESKFLQVSK